MAEPYLYIGDELTLFEKAVNWKNYFGSKIKPRLKGKVLEVGAGIGATAKFLCDGTQEKWICLEPDNKLGEEIVKKINSQQLPKCCSYFNGIIDNLPKDELFDAVIYIDVIEHIEDDKGQLQKAASRLKPGGSLIILVPAHQFLYSKFDKAIGHFRRYSRRSLINVIPEELNIVKCIYLDSVGLLSSLANKLILKQKYPSPKQIAFWDGTIVPVSKLTDAVTFNALGKSVLLIAEK